MTNWNAPSDAELDQVTALATRLENRTYFFDRLENPEWVYALARRRAFANPPDPVSADEPGYVQFPLWPEGRYLARMAPLAPDAVAAVLEELPPSANPGVTRIMLEAATALPDEQFRRLAPKTVEWSTSAEATVFANHFAGAAADAIIRLLQTGKIKQALKSAKALLWINRMPGASDGYPSDLIFTRTPEPVGRLSHWAYKRVVEKLLPDLVDLAGVDGVRLCSSQLSVAVKFSRHEDEPPDSDAHSFIWRPAIEDHSQNSDRGVRCLLVTAARDAAVRLARASDENLRAVVQLLEAGTLVHRRIALHVLAVVPGGAEMAAERIASRDLFDEPRLKHEYAELLRSRLGETPPTVRRTYLDWILAGPDLDSFRQRHSAASPGDEIAYTEHWTRDRLSIIADHLSGDEAEQYRQLVAKHGEAEHPDFLSWTESWAGLETPLTSEDMNSMPTGEIIEFLASWQPGNGTGRRFEPSMEGLGRIFQAVVTDRAVDFAAAATRMQGLDPTYVRSFLSGLEAAVKAGASFQWSQPILLMASVLDHPFEHEEGAPGFERDPGWSWTRGQAASLLQEGVADRNNRISFELREEVWGVLEPLTRDPNPTPDYEATNTSYGSMDPLTLSINTNRGKAMHAAIAYALWCRREFDARGIDTAAGFDLVPEIRRVLDDHLDPIAEPSLAVRAVYGKWLPWLILLDEDWAAANISRILPSDPGLGGLRDAAWNTYVRWCPPFDSVYDMLQHEYEAAVERIPSEGADDPAGNERAGAKLGEHLVTFYWRGCIQPAQLERWFELADDELAAHVMDYLGRSLNNTEGAIDPGVLRRIRQLWDSRLEVIASDPEAHQSEADAFAYTFASAKLDDDWSLASLEVAVLRPGGSRWRGHSVLTRLAEIAAIKPSAATRCTLRMLEKAVDDWDHLGWRDQVRDVLTATGHATDPETLSHRKAIVDHYIKRGELDFRLFVSSNP